MSAMKNRRSKDLTGLRVGHLLAVRPARLRDNLWDWLCQCDCGREIERAGYLLTKAVKQGRPSSCGCVHHLKTHGHVTKHASRQERLLNNVWSAMRQRCLNPCNKDFPRYGGRGISMCEAWGDFATFYDWAIAGGYRPGLTIERVNVNGDYEPTNCTWIPNARQALNWEHSLRVSYNGRTQGIRQWALECGLNYYTLKTRLAKGWSAERALTTPTQAHSR